MSHSKAFEYTVLAGSFLFGVASAVNAYQYYLKLYPPSPSPTGFRVAPTPSQKAQSDELTALFWGNILVAVFAFALFLWALLRVLGK